MPQATNISSFDVASVRNDFPLLTQEVNGHRLVYLDSAASAQKPRVVIDAVSEFYNEYNSNVHRGIHHLSQKATDVYEASRDTLADFLGAGSRDEIVFTKGTTESINLVAHSYLRPRLKKGDEVLISGMEHHANIVPWQLLCEEVGAHLKVIPLSDTGELILTDLNTLINDKTRILAVVHASNTLGTINPVEELIAAAHDKGVPVLLDGAQATVHFPVNVSELDVDFYTFSAHKLFGPTGIGCLYAKMELLESMQPYQGGGDMIESVSFEKTTFKAPPHRFEAGTPNIAGVIGMGAAISYVQGLDSEQVQAYEQGLLNEATKALCEIDELRIIGTAENKTPLISFVFPNIHPHDVGTVLDKQGIAVRTGHHCTQPLMTRYQVPATTRASFAFYNTVEEIDKLVQALHKVKELMG